jgi:hypothetical protein
MSAPLDAEPHENHDDEPREEDATVLSQTGVLALVWRKEVLGAAWVENSSSVLKFCEAADAGPDFRVMQSLKFSLDPTLIVTPSTSDPAYLDALSSACGKVAMVGDEADELGDDEPKDDPNGFMVTLCKNKDFSTESATKRLSLLRNLSDMPGHDLSDRERQLHLDHILPPDQEQACRAVGGLLAYLQRTDAAGSTTSITRLERCRLDKVRSSSAPHPCAATAPPLGP